MDPIAPQGRRTRLRRLGPPFAALAAALLCLAAILWWTTPRPTWRIDHFHGALLTQAVAGDEVLAQLGSGLTFVQINWRTGALRQAGRLKDDFDYKEVVGTAPGHPDCVLMRTKTGAAIVAVVHLPTGEVRHTIHADLNQKDFTACVCGDRLVVLTRDESKVRLQTYGLPSGKALLDRRQPGPADFGRPRLHTLEGRTIAAESGGDLWLYDSVSGERLGQKVLSLWPQLPSSLRGDLIVGYRWPGTALEVWDWRRNALAFSRPVNPRGGESWTPLGFDPSGRLLLEHGLLDQPVAGLLPDWLARWFDLKPSETSRLWAIDLRTGDERCVGTKSGWLTPDGASLLVEESTTDSRGAPGRQLNCYPFPGVVPWPPLGTAGACLLAAVAGFLLARRLVGVPPLGGPITASDPGPKTA